jgi:hypothetical protein
MDSGKVAVGLSSIPKPYASWNEVTALIGLFNMLSVNVYGLFISKLVKN